MRTISISEPILPSVEAVVKSLASGGMVVAPSDTVYGLLVDATNEEAVAKLLKFKNRPPGKPVSIFLADEAAVSETAEIPISIKPTLDTLIPGPFTVILKSKHKVSKKLESERGTIGVRVPIYRFINEVSRIYGKPITATSANISGKKPHYRLTSFLNQISDVKKNLLDTVVDAGQLPRNKPSTVVDLTGSEIQMLRKGDLLLSDSQSFVSDSPIVSKKIAAYIIDKFVYKYQNSPKSLVFLLEGEMGAGKTAFTQGMGARIGIEDIISPTYVVSYEYKIEKSTYKYFAHYDLYNLVELNEFEHIGLREYINNKNIIVIEWSEKVQPFIDLLSKNSHIVSVRLEHKDINVRKISVGEVKSL